MHGAQGPLLASLSSYRFVAHSFAPVLSLVAAEQAARAGVAWAGSPFLQGAEAPFHPFTGCAVRGNTLPYCTM